MPEETPPATLPGLPSTPAADAAGSDPNQVLPDGIAVCGSQKTTIEIAPFNSNWLIYACSPHNVEHRTLPRVDAWFEVHKPVADATRAYPYLREIEKYPVIWMRDEMALPYFRNGRMYPEEELKAEFGPFHFTSSIAYIMAMAIADILHGKAKPQIGVFGVIQAGLEEYAYQRGGIQHMVWEAARRGITVIAPDVSMLFEPQPDRF